MNFFLLLQTEGDAATQAANSSWMTMLFMGAFLFIFYFFMIRPQMKRQKEERVFREGLQVGDKVMTIGGIYGIISDLKEHTALVKVNKETKIEMDKTALRATPDGSTSK